MSYLFRFDGSRDNDDFMALRRDQYAERVYAGTPMKVGPWVPDFLEVAVDESARSVRLTLIELEATDTVALVSCRKYLPENSTAIVASFAQYLDSVVNQCRVTSDPRLPAFQTLKRTMTDGMKVTVHTAAALRTSSDFIEVLGLLDQPERGVIKPFVGAPASTASFVFEDARRMSRDELDGLRRVVRILHAVVVGKDHSGGTLKGYANLNRKPLEMALDGQSARFPELSKLVSPSDYSGAALECEKILGELCDLWSGHRTVEPDHVRRWIVSFHPIASSFPQHEPIQNVFDKARTVLAAK